MFAKIGAWLGRRLRELGLLVVTGLLGLLAWVSVSGGFSALRELRQLERTPRSLVAAVLPGEVNLQGIGRAGSPLLIAPETGTPTLYYRFHIEREETDSQGKKRWRTVSDERRSVSFFLLEDESGQIIVAPDQGASVRAERRHTRRSGDMRYTEYRIDPGERLFIFGYADERDGRLVVGFSEPGQYTPIISMFGESSVRSGMAGISLLLIWLGTVCSSLAVFTLCWLLRVHSTAVYLSLLCASLVLGMVHLASRMARDDLRAAYQRLDRDLSSARERIRAQLSVAGVSWSGDWSQPAEFEQALVAARLEPTQRELLRHLHDRMLLQIEVTAAIARQWPERVLARGLGLPKLPRLDESPRARVQAPELIRQPTRILRGFAVPLVLIGLGLSALFAWFGMRWIKLKRLVEDLPTTASAGVVYGLTELKGQAVLLPGDAPWTGPLTGAPCVLFRYVEQERRGSGRNARWVTLLDRVELRRFAIEDREGRFPVDPQGAELIYREPVVRRKGRIRRSEYAFAPGTPIYALGPALIDPQTESSLVLRSGSTDQPFLVTDLSEHELKLRKARRGFVFFNFSINAGNGLALAAVGGLGALHGAGFLAAALVPVAYLTLFLAILTYNDLVALRQRVRRAWANIQVSLQKRAELVPNLEQVLKSYMQHERGLETRLTELRRLTARYDPDLETAGQILVLEQALLGRLGMLREAYPELKANALASQLMRQIVALENEVALMRTGYNDSVERYNSRRQHVPELVFTWLFGFEAAEPFRAEIPLRALPALDLGLPSPPVAPSGSDGIPAG